MKKYQDKINSQADMKIRHIDESRKGIEFQIEVLTRTNGELLSRYTFSFLFLFLTILLF